MEGAVSVLLPRVCCCCCCLPGSDQGTAAPALAGRHAVAQAAAAAAAATTEKPQDQHIATACTRTHARMRAQPRTYTGFTSTGVLISLCARDRRTGIWGGQWQQWQQAKNTGSWRVLRGGQQQRCCGCCSHLELPHCISRHVSRATQGAPARFAGSLSCQAVRVVCRWRESKLHAQWLREKVRRVLQCTAAATRGSRMQAGEGR